MDQDNAIVQLENLMTVSLKMKSNLTNNVQIVQNYHYILDNIKSETQTMQDKVTELVMNYSK